VQHTAAYKTVQTVPGNQVADNHTDPLSYHAVIAKHRKFHPILIPENGITVGAVKPGKGFLALGVDVKFVKGDTVIDHKAFGDLAPDAPADGIEAIAHV